MPVSGNILGQFECSITANLEATETHLAARIASWCPFRLQLMIGHPRLQQLEKRRDDARRAGDGAKAKLWNGNRKRLIRVLAGQAAAMVRPPIKKRRQLVDGLLTIMFIANCALYWQGLYASGVLMDAILIWLLYESNRAFTAMECYVADIILMSWNGRKFDDPGRPMIVKENNHE